jgi:glutamate-1-semialdehyde 2,1-aminomutase
MPAADRPAARATVGGAVDRDRLAALWQRELGRFADRHPRSADLAAQARAHFLFGVPMHWMRDWPMPFPVAVAEARGHRLTTVDGHELVDYCLGDSGAMFGHGPPPVAEALVRQAGRGLTAMLPAEATARVGERLAAVFGLPHWQLTLSATDANRFALRWARAVTGRPRILVFDGCYHGTVDDTLVDCGTRADGVDGGHRALTRSSLLGQVHDLSRGTAVVPFNDLAAVRAVLAEGDIAAVLTEPALTNCGLVPPAPGFLEGVQAACRDAGALFMLDETHTLSQGLGGCTRAWGLAPDLVVAGKAIAGGVPCAVYGFTAALAARMEAAKRAAPEGHSGIGTTLSGSLLAMAALDACLAEVMTDATYARMLEHAAGLQQALEATLARYGLPWSVTRLGARMELQFCARAPRDAQEARAAFDEGLERALHLYQFNRGVLWTPFHNMLLVPPQAGPDDAARVVANLAAFLDECIA